MNTHLPRISPLIFSVVILGFCQCTKSDSLLNEILYNKPLSEIKARVTGEWDLRYGKGGICSICVQPYEHTIWKIEPNDSLHIYWSGSLATSTKIAWIRVMGTYTNGDSTWLMHFGDPSVPSQEYTVDRIKNDTLILHDNTADAVFYYFTRR